MKAWAMSVLQMRVHMATDVVLHHISTAAACMHMPQRLFAQVEAHAPQTRGVKVEAA